MNMLFLFLLLPTTHEAAQGNTVLYVYVPWCCDSLPRSDYQPHENADQSSFLAISNRIPM